jgi:glycerophosphoryl diester phosphodiesterase
MLILGHRGASHDFPENTLEAFVGAKAQGADGIELDVMRCASGELVVTHDEELTRLAGRPWVVARTPYWKLKEADVGSRLGFKPARIPLLHEVFDALPKDFFVNIELKCDTLEDRGLSVEVGRYVEREGLDERVVISSFNPLCLVRLAAAFPNLKRALLIDPDKPWWPQAHFWLPVIGRDGVHPYFKDTTEDRVRRWKERGLRLGVWTVDDFQEADRLEFLGIDYLITNEPQKIRNRGRSSR